MENSGGKMKEEREFALKSVAELYSKDQDSPATACFSHDGSTAELRILYEGFPIPVIVDLRASQLYKLATVRSVCIAVGSDVGKETSFSRALTILFKMRSSVRPSIAYSSNGRRKSMIKVLLRKSLSSDISRRQSIPTGIVSRTKSRFDEKIEPSAAKMYFQYYGQLLHQQNLLQDYVRTGTYHAAIAENCSDFRDRVVVDVGAGCGILSLFAAQAGAKHVYAVEASEMAEYARKLISGNPELGQRITVIKGKVEDVDLPVKADILISEPMGSMLVNERMLESYVIARDRFLVPDGKMFPAFGRIHMAPLSDEYLFLEFANKALLWNQKNYYGVDLRPLYDTAFQESFSSPAVDNVDPRVLIASSMSHAMDFTKIKEEDLYEIDIPLKFRAFWSGKVHGLACWFDVYFDGSTLKRWLSTAPGSPPTHWSQLCCALPQPIYVTKEQEITGRLHMIAHKSQSYTMNLTLTAKTQGVEQEANPQTSSCTLDLKDPYFRQHVYPISQQAFQLPQEGIPPVQPENLRHDEIKPEASKSVLPQSDSQKQNL